LACNGGDTYGRCGAGGFVGNGAQGNPPALRVFDDDAGVGGLNGQAERFAVGVLKAVGAAALHVEWGFHAAAVVKVQGAGGRGLGGSADAEQHGKSNEFHRDGFHRDVLSGCLGMQPASENGVQAAFSDFQVALTGGVYAELRYFHGAREGNAVTALPSDVGVAAFVAAAVVESA
jgi:hypothetical protein